MTGNQQPGALGSGGTYDVLRTVSHEDVPGIGRVDFAIVRERLDGTVSDIVAAAIRDTRKKRGWKVADLADRCAELGGGAEALTENVIENIESGRRRNGRRTRDITVDELLAIAAALGVPPASLFPTLGDGPGGVEVLYGLDDAIAGLQAARQTIEERLRRSEPGHRDERDG